MNKKLNLSFLAKVVTWLHSYSNKSGYVPLPDLLILINKLSVIQNSRGTLWLIKYLKATRGNLSNYLSGNQIKDPLSKVDKDGLPIILGNLRKYIKTGSSRSIALTYTILYSSRSLKLGSNPNTDSITQPYKGEVTNFSVFAGDFWRELGFSGPTQNIPKVLEANLKSYRSKSGPNGHSLVSSFIDAQALNHSQIKDLTILGGPKLGEMINFLKIKSVWNFHKEFFEPLKKICNKTPVLRRLTYFSDKEDKVRIIALLDWFSQLALKPLHLYLSNRLKRIPQDCTFDQSKFKKILQNKKIYYSVYLSSATDRFPIYLIRELLL